MKVPGASTVVRIMQKVSSPGPVLLCHLLLTPDITACSQHLFMVKSPDGVHHMSNVNTET